jgi:sn-glycerol 3-phosphate transport system substrate-binding protein
VSRGSLSRRALLAGLGAAFGSGCSDQQIPPGRSVVSLWFSYGGRNRETLEKLIRAFNTTQQRYYVRGVFQGDYFEGLAKLRTAIAARAAPAFSHVIGEVIPYLAEAGVLEPLVDYPGARELDLIPELAQEKSWVNGASRPLVALPFNRSTPIAYFNGEIFAREKRSPPTTWEELRETARALTVRKGGHVERHGFACPVSWWFWVALVGQAGGEVVERDGHVSLGGDAGVRAVEFWQNLVADGSMKPPPGRDYNAWEATNQDYLAGRVAMIWTSTAFLKYLEDNARFPVVAAPLPRDRRFAVPTGGTHWVMLRGAKAEEKAAAWAFLRFMHEPEQAIAWATQTGYMPVTRSAIQKLERDGYYAKHPNDRVAVDQLAVAMPWPWSPDLFRVQQEIVQPRLESAVLSKKDARTLLDQARMLANRSSGG